MYYVLLTASRLFALLPERVAVGLAPLLGRLWYALDGKRRRVARSNIALAYPEWPYRRVCAMARASFVHLVRNIIVFLRAPHCLRPETLSRYVVVSGEDEMRAAYKRGRGVVVLLAHWGNWEIGGLVCTLLGYPHSAVGRAFRSKGTMRFLNSTRARRGTRFIDKHEAVRPVLTALRGGECVGFFVDQTTSEAGTLTTFFGRGCKTTRGPAAFALKTGSPVVPVMCPLLPDGRYEVRFYAPIEPPSTGDMRRDIDELAQRMTSFVEARVRERPEQWLWMHRRWKPADGGRFRRAFRYVETILVIALDEPGGAGALERVSAYLREQCPQARIAVLVAASWASEIETGAAVDEVIAAPARGGWTTMRRMLKRRDFHLAIVLSGSTRAARLAKAAGIRLRVGSSEQGGRRLLTHLAPSRSAGGSPTEHWVRVAATVIEHAAGNEQDGSSAPGRAS